VELVLAFALILAGSTRILIAAVGLLAVFTGVLGWLLVLGDAAPACGCFGASTSVKSSTTSNLLGILRNLLLIGVSVCVLWPVRNFRRSEQSVLAHHARVRAGGFTLVELLIVLGLIATLMTLILAATAQVRETANLVRCGEQLRQIGLVSRQYAMWNHDYVLREGDPHPLNIERFPPWPTMFLAYRIEANSVAYLDAIDAIRILQCPTVTDDRPVGYEVNAIALSETWPFGGREAAGPTKLSQVRRASEVVYLAEGVDYVHADLSTTDGDRERLDGNYWPGAWDFWSFEALPSPLGASLGITDRRHAGRRLNLLFFDGHVKAMTTSELTYRMFDDGIRSHPNRRPIPRPSQR
jgi:prepilin-type processing-associated H-X9-DG protein